MKTFHVKRKEFVEIFKGQVNIPYEIELKQSRHGR